MPRRSTATVMTLLALLLPGGCARLRHASTSPLSPLRVGGDSVLLEVLFVHLPPAERDLEGLLWNEVDEQQLAIETRQRLEANGFRVGLVGGRLPQALERLLNQTETPAPAGNERLVELGKEPTIRGYKRQVREGEPCEIIAGQQDPHADLAVLICNDDREVTGKVFHKAKTIFIEKTYPQSDGRVRLELVPEIVHGEAKQQFLPGDGGTLQFQFLPPREAFNRLRIDATLSPGQILLIGGRGDREGSLGSHYFTESSSDGPRRQLLLIRLAQANSDALFADEPPSAHVE